MTPKPAPDTNTTPDADDDKNGYYGQGC